jgi:hypothetical protein
MSPEPTPEERLLRLIRNKPNRMEQESDALKESSVGVRPSGIPSDSSGLRYDIYSQDKKSRGFIRHFRWINLFLALVLIGLSSLGIYEIFLKEKKAYEIPRLSVHRENEPPPSPILDSKEEEVSVDIDVFASRSLFRSPEVSDIKETSREQALVLKDLTEHLILMGVVEGDPPQAIIQDQKLEKTYFLNEGDHLGDIQIQAGKPGLVTLELGGEKVDLRF